MILCILFFFFFAYFKLDVGMLKRLKISSKELGQNLHVVKSSLGEKR